MATAKNKKQDLTANFLNIYNELDSHFRKISDCGETTSHMFVVDRLSEKNKIVRNHREELKLYARLRNAIIHNPYGDKIDIIADPHPEVVKKYAALRDRILDPPLAMEAAIPVKKIYSTSFEAVARDVMQVMANRIFSYVPVLDDNRRIMGIFSENTVFLYLARNEICAVDSKTRISEFAEYLPLNQHMGEYFEFLDNQATLDGAKDLFEKSLDQRKRLAAIFITGNGRPDGTLMGMITAWDIAGNNRPN